MRSVVFLLAAAKSHYPPKQAPRGLSRTMRSQSGRHQSENDRVLRSFYYRRSRRNGTAVYKDESDDWSGYPPTLAIPELRSTTSGSPNHTNADNHFEKPPPVAVVYPPNSQTGSNPITTGRYLSSPPNPPEPYRYSRAANSHPFEPKLHNHQTIRSNQTGYCSYDADFSAYLTESEVSSSAGDYSFGGDSGADDMILLSRGRRHSTTFSTAALDEDRHESTNIRPPVIPNYATSRRDALRQPQPPAVARSLQDEESMQRQESCKTIEVAPGEFMKLRGSEETWRAVCNDFYMPGTCQVCSETIFCIQDADFVLCPTCRVVSPMAEQEIGGQYKTDGGVGLGFTMKDLAVWQIEIAQSRRST